MATAAHMATTARVIAPRPAARFGADKKHGVVRRGGARTTTVARASPSAATAVTPLTEKDLVDYLRSGCKPKSAWRCACTHADAHACLHTRTQHNGTTEDGERRARPHPSTDGDERFGRKKYNKKCFFFFFVLRHAFFRGGVILVFFFFFSQGPNAPMASHTHRRPSAPTLHISSIHLPARVLRDTHPDTRSACITTNLRANTQTNPIPSLFFSLFASCRRTPPCSTAAGAAAVAVAAANVDGEELHLGVAQARAK